MGMMEKMVSVLIMSAGSSRRMGGQNKQQLLLGGEPVLVRSVKAFLGLPEVLEILVVASLENAEGYQRLLAGWLGEEALVRVVAKGGATRQQSVFGGIEEVSPQAEYIAIHDGARPLVRKEDIRRVFADAQSKGAAILAVPVKDTIKMARDGKITGSPERSGLFQAQTPQVFERTAYLSAMEAALKEGFDFTDDAQLFEQAGREVFLTMGSEDNLKVTTPGDIAAAQAALARQESANAFGGQSVKGPVVERNEFWDPGLQPDLPLPGRTGSGSSNPRVRNAPGLALGQGYDVHRLAEGRRLVVGGVDIPWEKGLLGHSDADVLLHAIMDAILGALALGDIGKHFPDKDPRYKGADSRALLREVGRMAAGQGYAPVNIDATIIAQAPKMAPYILGMRQNIAKDLGISLEQVSVKATTEEGLGFTGRGEGISASAVCLLEKPYRMNV